MRTTERDWRSAALLPALVLLLACGEDAAAPIPAPGQHAFPVPTTGAVAPTRTAAPVADVRRERGFDMLRRELTYLGSQPATESHRIEVAARQIMRTVGWLELREVPLPPAVAALRPRLDEALADSPGDPPTPPTEPTLDPPAEVGGIFALQGAYLGRYNGVEGSGAIISTSQGPVVMLLTEYPDSVSYGDGVQACGALIDYQEEVDVRGKLLTARFYQFAEQAECRRAAKERQAQRRARQAAFKEEQRQYKLAFAEYETQLADHAYRAANFARVKQTALAGLPQAAQQALAGLPR